MTITQDHTRISIYVPQSKQENNPIDRLLALAEKRDRSLNYMVIEAILWYVGKEEKNGTKNSISKSKPKIEAKSPEPKSSDQDEGKSQPTP